MADFFRLQAPWERWMDGGSSDGLFLFLQDFGAFFALFFTHAKKRRPAGRPRLQKTLQGGSEGRSPPSCIPNPATCAVDSEALRSKVSLRVSPAALKAQGKRVLSEKIAAGELFGQAEAAPTESPPAWSEARWPSSIAVPAVPSHPAGPPHKRARFRSCALPSG